MSVFAGDPREEDDEEVAASVKEGEEMKDGDGTMVAG